MALVLFIVVSSTVLLCGAHAFIDNNPKLGKYQDDALCFGFKESWYQMLRNYEVDPYYGRTAKCVKVTEATGFVNDSTVLVVSYGGSKRWYAKTTLLSSEGYSSQNVVNLQNVLPRTQRNYNYNMTDVYIACDSCKVFRSDYIERGGGCSLWKPQSKVMQEDPCCNFVFDLLCGTSPKFYIYDHC
ncbi:hypothetical protein MTO96_029977 [Rhipicephalus appendiculatus]